MRSLACRIKDEVDKLVASGEFTVINMEYGAEIEGLQCGCALGVVSKVAGARVNSRTGAIRAIQECYPEATYEQLRDMEAAFEGWNCYWHEGRGTQVMVDRDSEFYKLGLHIRRHSVGRATTRFDDIGHPVKAIRRY